MFKRLLAFRQAGTKVERCNKLKWQLKSTTIAATLMLAAVFCQSCNNDLGYKRAYIISKSDDNNWTTSGMIDCDSFTMVSNSECIFYVDGRKAILRGQIIKCFSNTSYVSLK